ncbi:MAG TPA: phosphoribosylanthranilate isomerase [Longimicrobiales bacterium]|nr:phosphoribosylanthranilate isomerase [Longimicrobiales bacterium]
MEIKICGLCRPEDAALAVSAGATHAGVVRVPGTPRWRPIERARAVLDAAAGGRRVGVFADAEPEMIRGEAESLMLDVVQLHGDETPAEIVVLKEAGLEIWKVVKPADGRAVLDAATRYAAADLLLLEGTSARGRGGVGARFDWAAVAAVRDRLPAGLRLGVAGGLWPGNVEEAVARLRPALVDVSSGVEGWPGEKDAARVRDFVARARAAAGRLEATMAEER